MGWNSLLEGYPTSRRLSWYPRAVENYFWLMGFLLWICSLVNHEQETLTSPTIKGNCFMCMDDSSSVNISCSLLYHEQKTILIQTNKGIYLMFVSNLQSLIKVVHGCTTNMRQWWHQRTRDFASCSWVDFGSCSWVGGFYSSTWVARGCTTSMRRFWFQRIGEFASCSWVILSFSFSWYFSTWRF